MIRDSLTSHPMTNHHHTDNTTAHGQVLLVRDERPDAVYVRLLPRRHRWLSSIVPREQGTALYKFYTTTNHNRWMGRRPHTYTHHNLHSTNQNQVLDKDPFETLDRDGVGQLMKTAVTKGRAAQGSGVAFGICGEHGGDPQSVRVCGFVVWPIVAVIEACIGWMHPSHLVMPASRIDRNTTKPNLLNTLKQVEFVQQLGLDYTSCSPYRVPIARIAAAQAAIRAGQQKQQ